VDVGVLLIAGAQPLEGVQPGEAAFDDPALSAQAGAVGNAAAGDPRSDAAGAELVSVLVVVIAAVGEQLPRAPAGRPRLPRIGGTASTSGISWVTSLRLQPVSVTASGMPPASQIRWGLEPGRPRSTGEGRPRPPFERAPVGAVDGAAVQVQLAGGAQQLVQGGPHAGFGPAAQAPPAAHPEQPTRAAGSWFQAIPVLRRRRCLPARRGRRSAVGPDSDGGEAWAAATAERSLPTARQA
jgi:hypothetical protein